MVTHQTLDNPGRVFGCFSFSTILHAALLLSVVMIPAARIPLPLGNSTTTAEFEVQQQGETLASGGTADITAPQELPRKNDVLPALVKEVNTFKAPNPVTVAPRTTAPVATPQAPVEKAPRVTADTFPIKTTMPVYRTDMEQTPPPPASEAPITQTSPQKTLPPKLNTSQTQDAAPQATTVAALPVATPAQQSNTGLGAAGQGNAAITSSPTGEVKELSEVRQIAGNVPPSYPRGDRLARREGEVAVLALVNSNGTVTEVKLEKSSGSAEMSNSAMEAVKKYRFQPGQETWVRVPFQFALRGAEQEEATSTLRR